MANNDTILSPTKKTSPKNAFLLIGATYEGTQRNCRIQHNGDIRSSAFFSIIKPEWPSVKSQLKQKILGQF